PANLRSEAGAHSERHARELTVLLTGYGETGVAAVRAFATRVLGLSAELYAAVADGLSLRLGSDVRDESQLKTTSHEPRVSLQVIAGYVAELAGTSPATATNVVVDVNDDEAVITEVPNAA